MCLFNYEPSELAPDTIETLIKCLRRVASVWI